MRSTIIFISIVSVFFSCSGKFKNPLKYDVKNDKRFIKANEFMECVVKEDDHCAWKSISNLLAKKIVQDTLKNHIQILVGDGFNNMKNIKAISYHYGHYTGDYNYYLYKYSLQNEKSENPEHTFNLVMIIENDQIKVLDYKYVVVNKLIFQSSKDFYDRFEYYNTEEGLIN